MALQSPTVLVLFATALVSVLIVRRLDTETTWLSSLRSRFVLGVPWGTLLTISLVLSVYLFAQDGLAHWRSPLVLPFRAWSYLYPLGVIAAGFSHVSPSHLLGNLFAAATLGTLAEFAWGHWENERTSEGFLRREGSGSMRTSKRSTRGRVRAAPLVRILAVPVTAVVVGIASSLVAIGPVIGFSIVVFAFAGFAIVQYPITTVLALLASRVLDLAYSAIQNPITTASAGTGFSSPGWARIAIQGHAVGFVLGVLLGVGVLNYRRSGRPAPARIAIAVVLFGVSQSLWAVYWFRGGNTYVLFRALGLALVFSLAVIVAAVVSTRLDRASFHSIDSLRALRRVAPVLILLAALVGLSIPAIPANLTTVAEQTPASMNSGSNATFGGENVTASENGDLNVTNTTNGSVFDGTTGHSVGDGIGIRGYRLSYVENVTNRKVSVIDVSAFNETTELETSGVIVRNENRHIWTTTMSAQRLAYTGYRRVPIGGLGWRETVGINRNGWVATGGNTTYRVTLNPSNGPKELAYVAAPVTADVRIEGYNVSVLPTRSGFGVTLTGGDGLIARALLPSRGENVTVAGIRLARVENALYASSNDTRIQVAKKESYS